MMQERDDEALNQGYGKIKMADMFRFKKYLENMVKDGNHTSGLDNQIRCDTITERSA